MARYDVLVIGSGPAGQKAAIQGAKIGKKVGIVERKKFVGGICINSGTIPSKSLRKAVLFLSGFRQRNLYGASYQVKKTSPSRTCFLSATMSSKRSRRWFKISSFVITSILSSAMPASSSRIGSRLHKSGNERA